MNSRKLLMLFVAVALSGAAAWYSWSWYTMPAPPIIPLNGVDPELAEAVEKAVEEVRRTPRSGKAWGDLSRILIANGFNAQAIPCLVQAQRFDPHEASWPYLHGSVSLLLSKPHEGIPSLRHALGLAREAEERQAILFLMSQALIEEGQLHEAEQRLQALRDLEGDDAQVIFGLGLLARARDDRVGARKYLSALIDHPCARRQVGFLLASLTQDDETLADSFRERAAQLSPDIPWPSSFDAAVRQHRVTARPLDRYYELLAAGRREQALDFLRQAVAQSPDEQGCFALGMVLVKREEFEQAEKVLRQALAFNPRNLKAHLFLGAALLEQGQKLARDADGKNQALELFRQAVAAEDKALALQSDLALAHLIRGRALRALDRTDEALAALRQAALAGPDLSEAHQTLGEALAEAGHAREALEHLENAVRVASPLDPRPREALEKWQKTLP